MDLNISLLRESIAIYVTELKFDDKIQNRLFHMYLKELDHLMHMHNTISKIDNFEEKFYGRNFEKSNFIFNNEEEIFYKTLNNVNYIFDKIINNKIRR